MTIWVEIAAAITRELKHPVWGNLFNHVIAGELTVEDIEAACRIERPHPNWVSAVAGGNPDYLDDVAEIAFEDFIITFVMEKEKRELEVPLEDRPARVDFEPNFRSLLKGIFLN